MQEERRTDYPKHLPNYAAMIASLRPPLSQTNPAEWMYQRLVTYIKDFEAELDPDHEIGARLVSFGQSVTFHIDDIGFHGPDIITFYGVNEAKENVQLIQHISQLSVLLVSIKKQGTEARRIGFVLEQKLANT
jgi:hypothetical protein